MQLVLLIASLYALAVKLVMNGSKVENASSPSPNSGNLYSLDLLKPDARRNTRTAGGTDLQKEFGLARTSGRRRALLAPTTAYFVLAPYGANRPRSDGALAFYKTSKVVHSSQFLDATATACRTMYDLSSWGGRKCTCTHHPQRLCASHGGAP